MVYSRENMSNDDLAKYKDLFNTTASQYLASIKHNLTLLTRSLKSKEAVNELYICFHSLKSQSFAMQYHKTATICQKLEDACEIHKSSDMGVDNAFLTSLQDGVAKIENLLTSIQATGSENLS